MSPCVRESSGLKCENEKDFACEESAFWKVLQYFFPAPKLNEKLIRLDAFVETANDRRFK